MLDRGDEVGEVAVADDPAELVFALRACRSAVQRRHISPDCQRLTLRLVRRQISIIDSQGFVLSRVRFRLPPMPSRVRVSVSVEAFAERRGRAGTGALELSDERL